MAGPYYVDPAGSNTSPYDTWTKAATSLQTIADAIRAGEICYCRGSQTLAAAIDFDTADATGSNAAGFVKFIGCNAEGNVDGTYFTLNCNGQAIHGISATGSMDMVWLENIRIYNSGAGNYDGINFNSATSSGWVLNHCSFDTMGRYGVNPGNYDTGALYVRCAFYANGTSGISQPNVTARFLFCSFHDNTTGDGMSSWQGMAIGCLIYDNGDDGVSTANAYSTLYNCVIDQNADDGVYAEAGSSAYSFAVIGCRITNQSGEAADIGFNANSEAVTYGWNYIFHNGDNLANTTIAQTINVNGVDTNTVATEDSGNVDLDGYTSVTDGSEDYNLASDATARRTAIAIPLT